MMFHFLGCRKQIMNRTKKKWHQQTGNTISKISSSKRNLCQILWMKPEWLWTSISMRMDENEFSPIGTAKKKNWYEIQREVNIHRNETRLRYLSYDTDVSLDFIFKLGDYLLAHCLAYNWTFSTLYIYNENKIKTNTWWFLYAYTYQIFKKFLDHTYTHNIHR